jgi:hypothetical protein
LLVIPIVRRTRLLHQLQRGFIRIRNFCFLANRECTTLLPLCFSLIGNPLDLSTRSRQLLKRGRENGPMRDLTRTSSQP